MTTRARMAVFTPQRHISDSLRKQLQNAIEELYKKHFGDQYHLRAIWLEVPSGQLYTEAKQSSISAVSIGVRDHMDNNHRHQFMAEVFQLWMKMTGCNSHQLMLSAPDMSEQQKALALSQQRVRPGSRKRFGLRQLLRLCWNRVTRGHLTLSVNS